MYTRSELQTACSSRVDFQRGLSYYNESKVLKINYNRTANGDLVDLNAIVKGEHDDYSVHIVIDEGESKNQEGKLVLYFCTCPGSNEKKRICKHSIATLLKYIDIRENNEQNNDLQEHSSFRQNVGEISKETEENFLKVLTQENIKRRIEIRMKSKLGTMRLVPYVTVNDISMNVEFKAGESKLYIVKNIGSYVSAVYGNKAVSYGKSKNIVHDESLFDEESIKILRFLNGHEQSKLTYIMSYSQKSEEDYRFINLKKEVFGCEISESTMFDAVQVYTSNSRQATAKTKKRHEVSGGGKKPFRQKGTGRARQGSSRSPIMVGGGNIFGPTGNQNFKIKQNKKEHNLALRSAWTKQIKNVVVLDSLKVKGKTKEVAACLKALNVNNNKVVLVSEDLNVYQASSNINGVLLRAHNNVSVYDLLNAQKIVITKEDIKKVEEELA